MNILVLGGTEFMGKTLIENLLKSEENHVYMINRGKTYWNDQMSLNPKINYYYGDRDDYLNFEKLINYIGEKIGICSTKKWDLVVDFSCFERIQIKSVIKALKKKCVLYIFISSDSIYDVCDIKLRREDFIKEMHGIRPQNDKLIEELNDNEEYGNDKLKCEEYLCSHINKGDFNYMCFRFPDVIGPYDRSGRFWGYMLWLKNNQKTPIHVNKYSDLRLMSFVYSEDISNLIISILNILQKKNEETETFLEKSNGESFNICSDEHVTLKDLLFRIAKILKINSEKIEFIDEKDLIKSGKFFYPSVECGPITNKKAKRILNFKSTNFDEALKTTVDFFLKAENFHSEYKKAVTKYKKASEIKKI